MIIYHRNYSTRTARNTNIVYFQNCYIRYTLRSHHKLWRLQC